MRDSLDRFGGLRSELIPNYSREAAMGVWRLLCIMIPKLPLRSNLRAADVSVASVTTGTSLSSSSRVS